MKESTIKENKSNRKDNLEVALSCVAFLIIWQAVALTINNDIYIPTIGQTLNSLKDIVSSDRFLIDVLSSISRTIISFLIAFIVAFVVGVASYSFRIVRNMLKPFNALIQSIPNMVLIVLALIWFDKNNAPYIVGFCVVFPILYDSVLGSMTAIDKDIIEMANIYKVSTIDKILKIYIPSIVFRLVPIMISTLSLGFKVVIAGEVHGQPKYGIGTMVQIEKINFNTSGIFAWLVVILIISLILELMKQFILRRAFVWKR
ncbi:MAG: ABC transporter permease subunit [Romboutsia sp.]|nr:ABC transporter permease subunit [Romboutsia sp.]